MRKANYGISCNAVPYRDRRAGLNGREGVASCRAYIEQSIGGCYSVKCYSFVRNHVVSSAHDVFERIVESLDPLAGGRTPSFAEEKMPNETQSASVPGNTTLSGLIISVPETASGPFPPLPLENKGEFVDVDSCAVERTVATQTCFSLLR